MFKVTVAEYNHYSNETSDYYEVFPIKEDDPNEYYDGKDIEYIQSLCYN